MSDDFLAEDYRFTADLLRKYAFGTRQDTSLFRAVCSNNLNIILAALAHGETIARQDAEAQQQLREQRESLKDMLG